MLDTSLTPRPVIEILDDAPSGSCLLRSQPDVKCIDGRSGPPLRGRPRRTSLPGDTATLDRPDGGSVTVAALPALHGPPGCEEVTGPVIGFLLSGDDLETVDVSGDNASLEVVREIGTRVGPVQVAILFGGAVQLATRFDGAYLTLSADRAAEATLILAPEWRSRFISKAGHTSLRGADELRAAFHGNGVADRLRLPERGQTVQA